MPSIGQWISALAPSPMAVVTSLIIIGVGVVFIPALAYLKLVRPKGLAGRILWTIGAFVMGAYGLVQRESGQYELHAFERNDDNTVTAVIDGERMEVEEVPENWARLGKQPFLITYEKSERLFRDVLSDVGEAVADGGVDGERGGYASWVPEDAGDGYLIRVHRLLERLREAGGSKMADIAEREGLREFGGDSDMSNTVMIVYVGLMAILGFAAGIFLVT